MGYFVMRENWLTQRPRFTGLGGSLFLTAVVLLMTVGDWTGAFANLKATPELVYEKHQYYRLWTSLFVHADSSHILSNLILFVPLIYLLSRYFGSILWPLLAVLVGGLINLIVLQTLPSSVALVGISGVDNWLGAVWLTLFYLIDRRESRRRRFALVLFITFVLFVPDTYRPEISYLSHFVGYALGVISGGLFYRLSRKRFMNAEIYEEVIEPFDEFQTETNLSGPIDTKSQSQALLISQGETSNF